MSHLWWNKAALAKSVNKLLLAASVSEAPLTVVTWYFMFAFGLIYVRFRTNLWGGGARGFLESENLPRKYSKFRWEKADVLGQRRQMQ